ncbi:MAG: rhamnulokinase [Terracidiphilus sp.]
MSASVSFLAVDLGASSGRLMNCRWNGDRFSLEEIHRFPNGGVRLGPDLHWDVLRIWAEIQTGLKKFSALHHDLPAGIGVDAWGVDYCLLDDRDRLMGNPYHYRDARTKGVPEALNPVMSGRDLFRATGVQTMEINTAFQLASMALHGDRRLRHARSLLMIPDLFQFLLCGEKKAEYTEATTTQLYDLGARSWSWKTLKKLELPRRIFQEVVLPGAMLGSLQPGVRSECGFPGGFPCISVASHDTASAVAAIPELDDSSAFLSSGTWSLMGVTVDEPNLTDAAFLGGFTNEGAANGGVLLMKNMTGLWILQECVRTWEAAGKHYDWAGLEEAASKAAAFRSFIDPSASELQSPPDMCAAVRLYCARGKQPVPNTAGEIARCVFESLSFSYREALEDFERVTGRGIRTIRVVGGGCLNRFLCQMTADASGREVAAGPVEAAALGNAMVQAVATGRLNNLAESQAALKRSVEYQAYSPAHGSAWREAFERYKSVVARGRKAEHLSSRARGRVKKVN